MAFIGSVVINLVIFMLLPHLLQGTPATDQPLPAAPAHVVRMAPPPLPPQRQQAQKKPPQQVVKKQRIAHRQPRMSTTELHLNLPLRPDVAAHGGDIVLPEVQLAQLEPVPTIFDSAALDRPLTPVAQSPFIYPLRAKRLGIEGWVKVKLLISKQGRVEQVHILQAQPPGVFDSTVERGVRLWRFTPGTVDGEAVRSWVVTTVRFELES